MFLNLFRMAMHSFAALIAPENEHSECMGKRMAHGYRHRGGQSHQEGEVFVIMAASLHRSPGVHQRGCQGMQVVTRCSQNRGWPR